VRDLDGLRAGANRLRTAALAVNGLGRAARAVAVAAARVAGCSTSSSTNAGAIKGEIGTEEMAEDEFRVSSRATSYGVYNVTRLCTRDCTSQREVSKSF